MLEPNFEEADGLGTSCIFEPLPLEVNLYRLLTFLFQLLGYLNHFEFLLMN